MPGLILVSEGAIPPPKLPGRLLFWEKRDVEPDAISIPEYLDKALLDIRAEHMRWAYESGKLKDADGKTLSQRLECGATPSMWWTSLLYERHPKLSPLLYDIYKLRCLELIMRENKCDSLLLAGGDKRMRNVVKALCHKLNARFSYAPHKSGAGKKPLGRKIYEAMPAPLRALARYGHWWWTIRRKLPFIKANNPGWEKIAPSEKFPATIATYFPNIDLQAAGHGRFRSRYWENLHEALNEEAKRERPDGPHFVRWLFIRFPSPQLSLKQCLRLRDLFQKEGKDGLSFNYLEEFLSFKDLLKACKRWLKLCVASGRARSDLAKASHFANSELNFWPYIKAQYDESFMGWRCLERCLHNQAFNHYYLLAGQQRWNLFPLENCPWERMLTEQARLRKNPVYGAQHSIVRPTDFRYFDDPTTFFDPECARFQPDIICGNGASACQQWLANGMPKERLEQVEALRYQYLVPENDNYGQAASELPPEPGEPLAPDGPKRLLVLTSFFADETRAHLDLLRKSLDNDLLADWQIAIKPHPYLSVQAWLDTLPGEQADKIRILDGPLALILRNGAHVWASNSTTAALEAALKALPLMVMRPVNDFDLCPIQNAPGLLRTGSLAETRYGLEHMAPLALPPDYLDLSPGLSAWSKLLGFSEPA